MSVVATDVYKDHENLIYKMVIEFRKQYGGDFDELISEARLIYWELYSGNGRRYIREKPNYSFASSVCFFIRQMLSDLRRKQLYRKSHSQELNTDPIELDSKPGKPKTTFLVELFDELSEDSRQIVTICLANNGFVMRDDGPNRGLKKISDEDFLFTYLRNIGWRVTRIQDAFDEIKEALNS